MCFEVKLNPYQGNLTDQFRKTAANPNSVASVMTAPPLWKSRPPTAGSNARASGAECQCECSASASSPALLAFGSSKSSVEEKIDSENVELRLCLRGLEVSAKVEALPRGLWRRGD